MVNKNTIDPNEALFDTKVWHVTKTPRKSYFRVLYDFAKDSGVTAALNPLKLTLIYDNHLIHPADS